MKSFLVVRSQHRLRSPTAEQIFADDGRIEVSSAGTNRDAENPPTDEPIGWADIVVAMERTHRGKIRQRHGRTPAGWRIICLDIPGDHPFTDPVLIRLSRTRMARQLRRVGLPAHQNDDRTLMAGA